MKGRIAYFELADNTGVVEAAPKMKRQASEKKQPQQLDVTGDGSKV